MHRERHIGAIEISGGRSGGRSSGGGRYSGRSGGRFGGRTGRGGRGGRGRGRSGYSQSGVRLTSGYIDRRDWNTLSREERNHVLNLRGNRDGGGNRQVGATVTFQEDQNNTGRGVQQNNGQQTNGSGRGISALMTRPREKTTRYVLATKLYVQDDYEDEGTCELDSHADTTTIGATGRIIYDTGEVISVKGFHERLPSLQDVKVVTAALAYDDPVTSQTYILFFHQALYFPDLKTNLINPDQLREKGITVNEVPLLRLPPDKRTIHSHSIVDEFTGLHIPLKFNKPISYFHCRRPTAEECIPNSMRHDCIHVHMTCEQPWDPYNSQDMEHEDLLRAALQNEQIYDRSSRHIQALSQVSSALSPPIFTKRILHTNRFSYAIQSKGRKGTVTKEQLARRWRCGLDIAERTLQKTTQRAVRDFTHSTGGRRIKPTAYQLRYPRIRTPMYTDTLYGPCKSWEGNKYLAIYCTKFQWCRGYALKTKDESHYSLDKLFRSVGFPEAMIPDNALELTQGEFKRKLQRAQVELHPIEAYSPNLNAAEDCIRELKRMFRRVMNARNIPA
eukprot:scaffold727_cov104-Cylindrotheca_fusiformis.AAC.1